MADISEIQKGQDLYNIKDKVARETLEGKQDAFDNVSAEVDNSTGTPSVTTSMNNGNLHFAFQGLKGEQGIQGIQGPQGSQGDSVLVGQGDLPLAHVFGGDGRKAISQGGMAKILQTEGNYVILSSSLPSRPCSLGNGVWFRNGISGPQSHCAIPVTEGLKLKLKASPNSNFYAFLTSDYDPETTYTNNATLQTVSETNRIYPSKNEFEITIPSGCSYLAMNTYDGSNNSCSWEITIPTSLSDLSELKEKIEHTIIKKSLDTSLIDLTDWFIKTSSPYYWQLGQGKWQCRLIEIDDYVGGDIVIKKNNGICRYAFLKNDTKVNNQLPAFCDGESFVELSGSEATVTIPSDAKYLYVYANSQGTDVTPTLELKLQTDLWAALQESKDITENVPVKLRIAHWNIGHFSLGANDNSSITHEQYPEMRQKWAEAINSINADIMLCCEYSNNIVNASGSDEAISARDTIFSIYKYAWTSLAPSETSLLASAIFSNHKMYRVSAVPFAHRSTPGRHYYVGTLLIGGTIIKIVETHLDLHGNGSDADTNRALQIQQLIDDFADFDHVVIGGDFNVNSTSEYDAFVEAGYQMANLGYLGRINTHPSGTPTTPLDNIMCKGMAINGIKIVNEETLTDHCCIYADFTLIR